ncbi:YitT family protein [Dickeya solani]|uniref:YitT family protein n=1 Tax=Dickeya solani TaxID=1089444 RepID=A0ABU4ECL3_9GAMM|nr:YitT family protein [Dickeya solani]MCA7001058.1 YitT family protein [Dickeya solani]MCZ0821497.1 YitT family protein [Dickeya solani]MDV6996590.1 YitT family protein [Dickeya solani]MDV7002365.1 YitT family protein [Dickeya solani]MDV7037063.1 YitT family protein [Dickeya solani]
MLKESVALPKTAETGRKPGLAHTLKDDVYGLMLGVMFIAIGLNLLKLSGMITGGIAGIALLLSYFVPLSIGVLFILANIPFMVFCYFSMGRAFTLKTLIVNIALSAATQAVPGLLSINYIHPLFSALVGGTFLGMGILSLARHNASVGGTGVVTLWLYKRFNINAGKSQMLLDVLVFAVSIFTMPAHLLLWSAFSALAMNAMLMNWHKPGRYQGG